MALFKIFKGSDSGRLTTATAANYIQPTDGYAYYDTSTKLFYIDANYPGAAGITRQPINAEKANIATLALAAEKDGTGQHTIVSYYGHRLYLNDNNVLSLVDGNDNIINSSGVTLGALARYNAVSGSYTPTGTISSAGITITPTTTLAYTGCSTSGTPATFSTSISSSTAETLVYNFNGGTDPVLSMSEVWSGYSTTGSYVLPQTFTGTEATITLTPVTGGAENGDNVHF